MSGVADFTQQTEDALLNVDRAHKAFEKVQSEMVEAISKAQNAVMHQFNPILFESQSVLYEAMARASQAGFSYDDMARTMSCDNH